MENIKHNIKDSSYKVVKNLDVESELSSHLHQLDGTVTVLWVFGFSTKYMHLIGVAD